MTPEKVTKAFEECESIIQGWGAGAQHPMQPKRMDAFRFVQFDHTDRTESLEHLLFACSMGKQFVAESKTLHAQVCHEEARARYEKAMRWLGFIQGALWAGGLCSIEQMKQLNKEEADAVPSG